MGEAFAGLRAVARVLITNEAGELLLCRGRDGSFWVPPGGTVEEHESLTEAARREAEEEVGLIVTVGAMQYLQEFRPKRRPERVLEVAFAGAPKQDRPEPALEAAGRVWPAGAPDRPWGGWFIQDVDGPVREVRWFSPAAMAALEEPVYPAYLRTGQPPTDRYLGLVTPK